MVAGICASLRTEVPDPSCSTTTTVEKNKASKAASKSAPYSSCNDFQDTDDDDDDYDDNDHDDRQNAHSQAVKLTTCTLEKPKDHVCESCRTRIVDLEEKVKTLE